MSLIKIVILAQFNLQKKSSRIPAAYTNYRERLKLSHYTDLMGKGDTYIMSESGKCEIFGR